MTTIQIKSMTSAIMYLTDALVKFTLEDKPSLTKEERERLFLLCEAIVDKNKPVSLDPKPKPKKVTVTDQYTTTRKCEVCNHEYTPYDMFDRSGLCGMCKESGENYSD